MSIIQLESACAINFRATCVWCSCFEFACRVGTTNDPIIQIGMVMDQGLSRVWQNRTSNPPGDFGLGSYPTRPGRGQTIPQ